MIVCRTFLAVSFHILGYRRRRSNVKATTYIHWQRWTYKCGCPVQYKYVARVLSPLLPFSSSFRRLAMSFCGCRAGKMARKSRELALHNIQAPKFVGPCVARQPEYSQIQPCSPGVVNGWNTDSSTELFPGCFAPITTQKQGATGQSTFACIVIGWVSGYAFCQWAGLNPSGLDLPLVGQEDRCRPILSCFHTWPLTVAHLHCPLLRASGTRRWLFYSWCHIFHLQMLLLRAERCSLWECCWFSIVS